MYIDKRIIDDIEALRTSFIDKDGREVNNPVALRRTVGTKPLSLVDQIKRILRNEFSRNMQDQGFESFEEANDFDVDEEDRDPTSEYEVMQDEVVISDIDVNKAKVPLNGGNPAIEGEAKAEPEKPEKDEDAEAE